MCLRAIEINSTEYVIIKLCFGVMIAFHSLILQGTSNQMVQDLSASTTLYVGNLSFYTSEEQIYELFSKVGEIKRIIMGLDRNQKTPCGFCFVEYVLAVLAGSCKLNTPLTLDIPDIITVKMR
jgi:hypothetical protein